jgi:CBS domain-containing protein
MNASDIMKTSIALVTPDTVLIDVVRLLLETNQRALPVVDPEGSIVGIISEGDFLNRNELGVSRRHSLIDVVLESIFSADADKKAARSRSLTVKDVMTEHPVCVDEDASVDDVVAHMKLNRISQIPVVSGRFVVGLITRTELLSVVERRISDTMQPS